MKELTVKYADIVEATAKSTTNPMTKGTVTANFIKFMNELLNIMDLDESLKSHYVVMDNCTIHKLKPIIRRIERRGYRVIFLLPYSPELNPMKQFWKVTKGKLKRD